MSLLATPSSDSGSEPFRVDLAPAREVIHVRPVGELDLTTVGTLESQVGELLDAGFRALVLDLRELTFMDSTGVRMILDLDALARREELQLTLIEGPKAVQRVLAVCGVADRLPFGARQPSTPVASCAAPTGSDSGEPRCRR